MTKFDLLQKTSAAILAAPDYSWSHGNRCNVGLLIEVARGMRATTAEFRQGAGLLWCQKDAHNHVVRWLKSEYGFTSREIDSIELLNDRRLVRLLARRGIQPAPLFNRSRKYVSAYLAAMAAREKRRVGKSRAKRVEALK